MKLNFRSSNFNTFVSGIGKPYYLDNSLNSCMYIIHRKFTYVKSKIFVHLADETED